MIRHKKKITFEYLHIYLRFSNRRKYVEAGGRVGVSDRQRIPGKVVSILCKLKLHPSK